MCVFYENEIIEQDHRKDALAEKLSKEIENSLHAGFYDGEDLTAFSESVMDLWSGYVEGMTALKLAYLLMSRLSPSQNATGAFPCTLEGSELMEELVQMRYDFTKTLFKVELPRIEKQKTVKRMVVAMCNTEKETVELRWYKDNFTQNVIEWCIKEAKRNICKANQFERHQFCWRLAARNDAKLDDRTIKQ